MRKLAVASLLLMVLHSPIARGNEELPAPIVFVANFLQLNNDQTGALVNMIRTRDALLRPIAAQLQSDQEALAALLESPAPDATAIGRLLIDIHTAQKQANAIAQSASASFEEVLTAEQRQRLQFVRQAAQIEPAISVFKAIGLW